MKNLFECSKYQFFSTCRIVWKYVVHAHRFRYFSIRDGAMSENLGGQVVMRRPTAFAAAFYSAQIWRPPAPQLPTSLLMGHCVCIISCESMEFTFFRWSWGEYWSVSYSLISMGSPLASNLKAVKVLVPYWELCSLRWLSLCLSYMVSAACL